MRRYVDDHFAGHCDDATLGFHSQAGGQFVRLVEGYRPEDAANGGVGVLVEYDVKRSLPRGPLRGAGGDVQPKVPSLELLQSIMTDLGYPPDQNDLTKSFFDYGMDSLELVRIRNKLTQQLDLDLPATLLLDFPTVHDLSMQLDRDRRAADERREVRKEERPSEALGVYEPPRAGRDRLPTAVWENLSAQEVMEIQRRMIDVFAQRSLQKRFTAAAKNCFPDMLKYVLSIEHIMVEVEGPVLLDFGLIDDLEYQTVQASREQMTSVVLKYWLGHPELRTNSTKMLHLTLQDQHWGDQGAL